MKTPRQLWRLCFVAILAIAMMPAQLQAQSEIPKLKAPTRKLRTAFSKVVAQHQMNYNYTYAMEETKARYATVMAKVPEEMAAANWFMAEMTDSHVESGETKGQQDGQKNTETKDFVGNNGPEISCITVFGRHYLTSVPSDL